jgi:signal transduction histidine kinase/ActR/RegA family two-component response regulator
MQGPGRAELSRMLATPLITIGALGAILVWEFENVGSTATAILIAVCSISAAAVVAAGLRGRIVKISRHYEGLLATADEQSRRAETASRVKDEFLSTLSHELRTPLNSVLGWARLLATGKLTDVQTARAIAAIERAGWTQSHLIENLLDVSRMVEGKLIVTPRLTVVGPIIEGAIEAVRKSAEGKRVAIDANVNPRLGPVSVDPNRLHQIVWHLVSNAVKFTPAGGHVTVDAEPVDHELKIVVRDTGIGFQPQSAQQLFEQFQQADTGTTRRYGGLGLGLAIARHLVEQHGGTIAAHSDGPDQGAEFEVRLPTRGGVPNALDQATPPVEPVPLLRGLSILLVDDNPDDREFVRTSLEHYGAVVRTAGSTREACERFRRDRPDVLVSDLAMPDEDGLELIRQIRVMDERVGRLTPAAALSALARADDRRRALNAGYQMHVTKPIDPLELASTIERLAAARVQETRHA